MRILKTLGRLGLASMLLCGALQLRAAPEHYVIHFTAKFGIAPTSGSFDYDSSQPAGSRYKEFVIKWGDTRFDFTSAANLLRWCSGTDCPSSSTPGRWDFQCARMGMGSVACLPILGYTPPRGEERYVVGVTSAPPPVGGLANGTWYVEVQSTATGVHSSHVPDPRIDSEIATVLGSGRYSALPAVQTSKSGTTGRTSLAITNDTQYSLQIMTSGLTTGQYTISPGATQEIVVLPGSYKIIGRVSASNVLPFYGTEKYAGGWKYSYGFYLQ